jgi:hypothetical protein
VNSLTRTSSKGGTNYRYQYRYANPCEVGPHAPLQTEFWIPKGRKGGSWARIPDPVPGLYKTWRKVRPGHSHADKLAHSITRIRDTRCLLNTVERQCETYLQWARLNGLNTVSVFPGSYGQSAAKPFGFTARPVDLVDYNGEPATDEYDCYGDWDHDGHPSNTLGE